jgi:hypothetical protein
MEDHFHENGINPTESPIEHVVIFNDGSCGIKLQDPKVLIACSGSTKLVVFGKKNLANSIELI